MLLIDAHVHIYDCYDLERFFDSAYANFKFAAKKLGYSNNFTGVLLLAETSKDNWFQRLTEYADGKDLPGGKNTGSWIFRRTNENISLLAESTGLKDLVLVAGRQIVTEEGLEVLACATVQNYKDGAPIKKLINEIIKIEALPIIPWGFGKWIGRRGKILKTLVETAENTNFFFGDNGGRPKFMPRPPLFQLSDQKGIRILSGTDPLPLKTDNCRAGSFGFGLRKIISNEEPGKDLSEHLLDPTTKYEYFGLLKGIYPFMYNQVKLRLKFNSITQDEISTNGYK